MDFGKILGCLVVGVAAGVTVGILIPEERKGKWAKEKQSLIEDKWKEYDIKKEELEERKQAFLNRRKKQK